MRVGIALFFSNHTDWERFDALERGENAGPMQIDDARIYREQRALADLVEPRFTEVEILRAEAVL